jgi:hypothetical protein
MWPFHRHKWELVAIHNSPNPWEKEPWGEFSHWTYACQCGKHMQRTMRGHYDFPSQVSSSDAELTKLRKIAELE